MPIAPRLSNNWPRNEMGYYEPWNNPRYFALPNRNPDEQALNRFYQTPRSRKMRSEGRVSPAMQASFDRAEVLATERQIRQGRNPYFILQESRVWEKPEVPDGPLPWYADMPNSFFYHDNPGSAFKKPPLQPLPPAEIRPEPGVDGYSEPGSRYDSRNMPYYGRRYEEYFQQRGRYYDEYLEEWYWDIGPRYIDEQAEQDAEFRVRYQAYF